jgi:hypothetical protein
MYIKYCTNASSSLQTISKTIVEERTYEEAGLV